MIEIRNKATGARLGSITEEELQFMIDQLEEESLTDQDYYINPETLDMFAERGADERLLELLRNALGDQEDMEIEWKRS